MKKIKKPFGIYDINFSIFLDVWFEYSIQAFRYWEKRLGSSNNFEIVDIRKNAK